MNRRLSQGRGRDPKPGALNPKPLNPKGLGFRAKPMNRRFVKDGKRVHADFVEGRQARRGGDAPGVAGYRGLKVGNPVASIFKSNV